MRDNNTIARSLGFWSASVLFIIGVCYAIVLVIGIASTAPDKPITDPILAIMEVLTFLSAPVFVTTIASIHYITASQKQVLTFVSVCFAILMAGLTCSVHFVALTAGRQMNLPDLQWPSMEYAIELLSWDVFLGLSLLFSAPVFEGSGKARLLKNIMLLTGVLCIAGTIGPLTGDMRFQYISIAGYAIFLPVTAFILALYFRQLHVPE